MYRILLLAQEEALYSRLEAFLDGDHYSVRRCDSPTAAHELMVQHIPDCIFIDFRDPGFDPVFFCRTLKDNSRFQHVPILYLSLQITCDLACNLLSAGAYDCLERDVDSKLLAAKIFAMMGLKRDLEELGKLRRFQSFGDSLGVFAHDLNNPLSVAVGNVYWLKRNIIDQSQTLRLGRVSEALDRITHLIVKARGVRESLDKDINTTDVDLSAPSKK